jgi:hypothetical protein
MQLNLERQAELIPLWLRGAPILIGGLGVTGSWTAHALLREGFTNLTVCDFDEVESHNIPAQFNFARGGMRLKTESFVSAMKAIGLPTPRVATPCRISELPAEDRFRVVFSCADSLEGRLEAAERVRPGDGRLIEWRMGPETGSILYATADNIEDYKRTLRATQWREAPTCGARAIPTTGLMMVGLGVGFWMISERGQAMPGVKRIDVGLAGAFVNPRETW